MQECVSFKVPVLRVLKVPTWNTSYAVWRGSVRYKGCFGHGKETMFFFPSIRTNNPSLCFLLAIPGFRSSSNPLLVFAITVPSLLHIHFSHRVPSMFFSDMSVSARSGHPSGTVLKTCRTSVTMECTKHEATFLDQNTTYCKAKYWRSMFCAQKSCWNLLWCRKAEL